MIYTKDFWYSFDRKCTNGQRFVWFLVYFAIPFSILMSYSFMLGVLFGLIIILSRERAWYLIRIGK